MTPRWMVAVPMAAAIGCSSAGESAPNVQCRTQEFRIACDLELRFQRFEVDGALKPSRDIGFDSQLLRSRQELAFVDGLTGPLREPVEIVRSWPNATRSTRCSRTLDGDVTSFGECSGTAPFVGATVVAHRGESGTWEVDPKSSSAFAAQGIDSVGVSSDDCWRLLLPLAGTDSWVEQYRIPDRAFHWLLRPWGAVPFRDGPGDCAELWGAIFSGPESDLQCDLAEVLPDGARYRVHGWILGQSTHVLAPSATQTDEIRVDVDGTLWVAGGNHDSFELCLKGTAEQVTTNAQPRGPDDSGAIEFSFLYAGTIEITASARMALR